MNPAALEMETRLIFPATRDARTNPVHLRRREVVLLKLVLFSGGAFRDRIRQTLLIRRFALVKGYLSMGEKKRLAVLDQVTFSAWRLSGRVGKPSKSGNRENCQSPGAQKAIRPRRPVSRLRAEKQLR